MSAARPDRAGITAVMLASAIAVGALGGVAAIRVPVAPVGQIVTVPVARLSPAATGPSIAIEECTPGPGGLLVRGRVQPPDSLAADGQVVVAVTGSGTDRTAGRAVGLGFAASTGAGDAVGSFRLELPWAAADSEFGILWGEGPVGDPAHTGPVARCPVGTR